MAHKMKYKACIDCISDKGICVYCDSVNCYNEPVTTSKRFAVIGNYNKLELFENEEIENDFPIEHWANEHLNEILYGGD